MSAQVGIVPSHPERLEQLIPEGNLEGGTPFRLYYLAAGSRATGRLILVDEAGPAFEIFFDKGVPTYVRSTSAHLSLGRYLIAQGVLDPETLAQAQSALQQTGGDVIEILSRVSRLEPLEAFEILSGYGRALLARALVLEAGSFRWLAGVASPPGASPLGETWTLVRDAGRRLSTETVVRWLGQWIDQPITRADDGLVSLDSVRLNGEEVRIVASFDGRRSLAQLAAASPASTETILRLGYFLAELGFVSFLSGPPLPRPPGIALHDPGEGGATAYEFTVGPGRRPIEEFTPNQPMQTSGPTAPPPPRAAPRPRPAAPSAGARPSAPPLARPAREAGPKEAAGLDAYLASLKGKNHFEVLGVTKGASGAEVKNAFFRLARLYHPDTAGPGSDADRRLKEQITARLNEANHVLGNDRRRADYVLEIETTSGPEASPMDIARILEAEKLFRHASLLTKARRFREAIEEMDRAIELNDAEGEFYAWRAFARFSATPDKRKVEVQVADELRTALAKSPNCAMAYLFSARIANVLGDIRGAIQYYKRCLQLEEGNVDAMRELRLIESRTTR